MADRINSGAMFKNMRKTTDNHPDYNGSINIGGTEYWISGWIKTAGQAAKNPGSKFLSLAISPKEESRQQSSGFDNKYDDDMPF